jgi:hypothetical protein
MKSAWKRPAQPLFDGCAGFVLPLIIEGRDGWGSFSSPPGNHLLFGPDDPQKSAPFLSINHKNIEKMRKIITEFAG